MTAMPVLIVAGLGRCGTTLMMTALAAAGMPCVGPAPVYEPAEVMPPINPAWLAAQAGRAVKVLDPQRSSLPSGSVAIFMTRDADQQAASQAKFAHMLGSAPAISRAERRGMAVLIREDTVLARRALPRIVATVAFEAVLKDPRGQMRTIADALAPWWPDLCPDRMASVVIPRSPACAPGLDIEMALMRAVAQ